MSLDRCTSPRFTESLPSQMLRICDVIRTCWSIVRDGRATTDLDSTCLVGNPCSNSVVHVRPDCPVTELEMDRAVFMVSIVLDLVRSRRPMVSAVRVFAVSKLKS